MSITFAELKLETNETFKDLILQDWKDKSDYRAITRRSQYDFDNLIPMYVEKIGNIRERLRGDWTVTLTPIVGDKLKTVEELGLEMVEEIQHLLDKETRLIDKFATCVKEVEMRKDRDVIRTGLHDQANYYIDYVNGDDARTGLNPDTTGDGSWKTITKYTTTTVRTPGDIAYLRANTTWLQGTEAVDIIFDEDGTIDDYIKIIGCDASVNDPWTDSSDVKPIIDFENAAYNVLLQSDNYWYIERLDFRQSSDTFGIFYSALSDYLYLLNCHFQDVDGVNVGLYINVTEFITVDGCTFLDCSGDAIKIATSVVLIKNTTITAGVDVSTDYGIQTDNGTILWMEDVTFSGSFDAWDIRLQQNSTAWVRNINWSGSGILLTESSVMYSEDEGATFENHITFFQHGTITRGTTSPRAGGADSFAIMEPKSLCGPNRPLVLGDKLSGFAKIWVATNAASTITIYVRVDSAWDSALTVAECYIKASYLSDGANADRTELQSTEQITNDTNWTALTVTIPASNPKRDGWVYVWFYLEEFEDATEKVDVDIKPVIS